MLDALSLDQKKVIQAIAAWYRDQSMQYLTVGGYAGTGKTTLIAVLRKLLHKHKPELKIAFATFTGKASQVLSNKLQEVGGLYQSDTCGTIHSLMYRPQVDSRGKISSWYKNKQLEYDLIIIDEASMVTSELWNDLLSYHLPVIAVGDHGQLPPVGDSFNLMETPHVKLERIHRQAEKSPIVQMATLARLNGKLEIKDYGPQAKKFAPDHPDTQDILDRVVMSEANTLILTARNKTRIKLNQYIRGQKYFETPEPQVNDQVICLKNIYHKKADTIYNGMIGTISRIQSEGEHWYLAQIDFPQEEKSFEGRISKHQFNQASTLSSWEGLSYQKLGERFDFGYALTVHKAQGSQAETVVVYEESAEQWMKENYARWLYTAITRATDQVYVIA